MTGHAAELAAEILLARKPKLLERVDWDYLYQKDRRVTAEVRKLLGGLGR